MDSFEGSIRFDKFVADDFHAHTLYGGQVVITNPTSTPRAVDLLIQIPAGAVATNGSQETSTTQFDLAAFSTQTFEYNFYFPTAGKFGHYPAHVSADEKVLAIAEAIGFVVTDLPAALDTTSWAHVSQNGSEDEVIEFLNQQNILRLDLKKIAFRMTDKSFFNRVIQVLRNRYVYDDTLWSYSIKHDDPVALAEFLTHATAITKNCGSWFESKLLKLNPVERNWYQHREYWPLVNARAHQLGPQRKILNPSFANQYNELLIVLAYRPQLTPDDHLTMTYYMLLQDRLETALVHFEKTKTASLPSKIQYDYCDAYLDLYRGQPDSAAKKAEVWVKHPVEHWRKRFENILAQVAEIKGAPVDLIDKQDQTQQQTMLAANSPSFDFKIEGGEIRIIAQNLSAVTANFYEMDLELLFSRNPFAQKNFDGFSLIRPNVSSSVKLEPVPKSNKSATEPGNEKADPLPLAESKTDTPSETRTSASLKLPDTLRNKNVLVEIVSGDAAKSELFYANSLDLQVLENYGQLLVLSNVDHQPVAKTYIKVYSRMADGSERFHKDGYTDLRGRFDYVSQSNIPLDGIQEFSILVLSEELGAVIRSARLPAE